MSLRICILFALLGQLTGTTLDEPIRYDKYRVYRVSPETNEQVDFLKGMQTRDSLIFEDGERMVGRVEDIIVAPHVVHDFVMVLKLVNITTVLVTSDLQRTREEELIGSLRARYDNYREYHMTPTTPEQVAALRKLSSESIRFMNGVKPVGFQETVLVAPHKLDALLEGLDKIGIQYTLVLKNLQKAMDDVDEQDRIFQQRRNTTIY